MSSSETEAGKSPLLVIKNIDSLNSKFFCHTPLPCVRVNWPCLYVLVWFGTRRVSAVTTLILLVFCIKVLCFPPFMELQQAGLTVYKYGNILDSSCFLTPLTVFFTKVFHSENSRKVELWLLCVQNVKVLNSDDRQSVNSINLDSTAFLAFLGTVNK